MSWRTIVISSSAKLDYKLDYLVVRQEEITKIHLSEISILLIENTAVSITAALLNELIKRKIKVIFCDEKRNPSSELVSYYGCHDSSAKIRNQIRWNDEIKELIWTEIVSEKIRNQRNILKYFNKKEYFMLDEYLSQIEIGDTTNREGHSAKVYFNALFGMDFTRTSDTPTNAALNYGYGILLSTFNREIVANGYITQLGLFHDNMFNHFNLGSDLMEPFRTLVDKIVYNLKPEIFNHNEKMELLNILNKEVIIDGKINYVNNAIKIYCKSVFDAINQQDVSLIKFYKDEL
ncbi:MAG: type II CRISPR-associated endonuclease Cas1 [Clostridia bacterium]|jgi:CRISPR-associated protein Cas1|nr:type II CRISPR-associated endonuclease Cas1 [Clostridia bacterium]